MQSKFAALSGGPSLISTSTNPWLLLSGADAIAKKPGLLSPTLICINWPAVLYPSAKLPTSMTTFLSCKGNAVFSQVLAMSEFRHRQYRTVQLHT